MCTGDGWCGGGISRKQLISKSRGTWISTCVDLLRMSLKPCLQGCACCPNSVADCVVVQSATASCITVNNTMQCTVYSPSQLNRILNIRSGSGTVHSRWVELRVVAECDTHVRNKAMERDCWWLDQHRVSGYYAIKCARSLFWMIFNI